MIDHDEHKPSTSNICPQCGAHRKRTFAELTRTELDVARAVATGASNREIAASLFMSNRTVESHLTRIFRKLEIDNRTSLAIRIAA